MLRIDMEAVSKELGVPFSDPMADGPTNQRAAERALAAGTSLKRILEVVREIRERSQLAIVLFTYANPVVRFGIERFAGELLGVLDSLEMGVAAGAQATAEALSVHLDTNRLNNNH